MTSLVPLLEVRAVQIYSLESPGLLTNVDLYYDTMTMLAQFGHMGWLSPSLSDTERVCGHR